MSITNYASSINPNSECWDYWRNQYGQGQIPKESMTTTIIDEQEHTSIVNEIEGGQEGYWKARYSECWDCWKNQYGQGQIPKESMTTTIITEEKHTSIVNEIEDGQEGYWKARYRPFMTVYEMICERFPRDQEDPQSSKRPMQIVADIVANYARIVPSVTLPKYYKTAVCRPLNNVVWLEDFFHCDKEGFKVRAINPWNEVEMTRLKHLIRWDNNQVDYYNPDLCKNLNARVVVFQPARLVVNGEEQPLTLDLIDRLYQKHAEEHDITPPPPSLFVSELGSAAPPSAPLLRPAEASCYSLSSEINSDLGLGFYYDKYFPSQVEATKCNGEEVPSVMQMVVANAGWYTKSEEYIQSPYAGSEKDIAPTSDDGGGSAAVYGVCNGVAFGVHGLGFFRIQKHRSPGIAGIRYFSRPTDQAIQAKTPVSSLSLDSD